MCNQVSYTATKESQEISSPNYPRSYCHGVSCYTVITAEDPGMGVELTLSTVDLGSDGDTLRIFDAEKHNGQIAYHHSNGTSRYRISNRMRYYEERKLIARFAS